MPIADADLPACPYQESAVAYQRRLGSVAMSILGTAFHQIHGSLDQGLYQQNGLILLEGQLHLLKFGQAEVDGH